MSPDPAKCKTMKEWPQPKSCNGLKSFLQTVQFNTKFLGGKVGQASYPEDTEPYQETYKVLLGTKAGMGIPRNEGQTL